jgi:hypothetical protein
LKKIKFIRTNFGNKSKLERKAHWKNNQYLNIGTFRSARWQKDHTPDLSMMTQESADEDITTTRHIISNFPRRQHRPVTIHYGMKIPLMNSAPKPRWNFLRADWKAFADDLEAFADDGSIELV